MRGYYTNIRVKWYGKPVSDEYFAECKEKLQRLKLDDIITLLPPSQKIENAYHEADIFVLPSLYEGFPNVLCEAMSCGLPVLTSNTCDNPNIVGKENSDCLFNPTDVADIAACIKRMLDKGTDYWEEKGLANRKIADSSFSKEKFVEGYLSLIE